MSYSTVIHTTSRTELVMLSGFLARAAEPSIFYDRKNVPVFWIYGWPGGGKSLVVEAMMKAVLDKQDLDGMLSRGHSNRMFLEPRPMFASHHYVSISGKISGHSATLAFDRVTSPSLESLREKFAARTRFLKPSNGAIFCSEFVPQDFHEEGMLIKVGGKEPKDNWERKIRISIASPAITETARFNAYWEQISKYEGKRTLKEPEIYAPVSGAKRIDWHMPVGLV